LSYIAGIGPRQFHLVQRQQQKMWHYRQKRHKCHKCGTSVAQK
jgi:hypothetical protein